MSRRRIVRTILVTFTVSVASLHAAYIAAVAVSAARYRTHDPRSTALMRYRAAGGDPQEPPRPIALGAIPAPLVRAVIYIEDFDFYRHHGFDLESIRHAIRINRRLGYRAYGGSTITQQLARTLFLVPHKSYLRKYLELLAAVTMELVLPKDRILELYLNYAEWGPGIWGIRNAASSYFSRPVAALTADQIVRLVTVMPSPLSYTPDSFESNAILLRRYRAVERYVRHVAVSRPELSSRLTRVDAHDDPESQSPQ